MKNQVQQLIFALAIFFTHSCASQDIQLKDCDIQALKNVIDSIPLAVCFVQNTETAPYSTLYRVEELSPNSLFSDPKEIEFLLKEPNESLDKDQLKKIKSECWLYLLNHPDYEWKTNLFLYFLFERDALFLIGMKPDEWKENYKEMEIETWREYLH